MSNENQKPVTDQYRENWDRIFGKKKEEKGHACAYSRSLDQDFPRRCVICGKEEQINE